MYLRFRREQLGTLVALTCAFVLTAVDSASAGKKSLRLSGASGTTQHYRLEAQNETHFSGITITENTGGDVQVDALDAAADGNPRFAVSFANFESSVMQGGNLVEQDPQLNGVTVHVTFSPRGELLDMAPQSNMPQARREVVENLVDAFFAFLPEEDVERDDTWVHKRLEEGDSDDEKPAVDGETEYTLEEFEKKDGAECAKLYVEGKAQVNRQTPAGMFSGEAKTEGEVFVVVDGGHVLHCKLTTEINGNVGTQEISRVQYLEIKPKKG